MINWRLLIGQPRYFLRLLGDAMHRFYIRQSDVYPPRWYWPITRIYGGPDGQEARTCYMTRVLLGPATRWGQLYLHIFHRPDGDRDPHDHPFDFWTFPFNKGYLEEVYEHHPINSRGTSDGCFKTVHVPRWYWSKRVAQHTHRVVAVDRGTWPLVTMVWRSVNKRRWGFWTRERVNSREREFTPYRKYVYHGENANLEGNDVSCPGTSGRYYDAGRPS